MPIMLLVGAVEQGTHVDEESVGLLRDGMEALVGVLAIVTGVDIDETVQ